MSKKEKNEKIKKTMSETHDRRKGQSCKVFEIKVDMSHLSKKTAEDLNRVFLDAKWLYNHILASEDIFKVDTKGIDKAIILNKDKEKEEREIRVLGSQIKQSIVQGMKASISGLSATKKKGKKVGRLKFKSWIGSVDLKQFGITYRILGKNKIKMQGIKQSIKVHGLEQIKGEYEIANAKFIKRNNNFFFNITCFVKKEKKLHNPDAIGIDFGIKTDLTFSEGTKMDVKIIPTKQIKKKHQQLSKKKKGSQNNYKAKKKLNAAYEKQNNIKKEIVNQTKGCLNRNFGLIAVQKENIKGWHAGLFGKQVQQSAIGGIMRGIKQLPQTQKPVDKFFPSTQLCPECKTLNKIGLDERTYVCPACGYTKDRDTHSAGNILEETLKTSQIPTVHRDFKPVEKFTAAFLRLSQNCKWISVKQEATQL